MTCFSDKTVLIAGAATDVVWRLLPDLDRAGARVVLMDEDADEVLAMAQEKPTHFEPLPLSALSAKTCQTVGQIWDDEPIHILLDFIGLSEHSSADQKLQAARSLLAAFEPALKSSKGSVVSVIPRMQNTSSIGGKVAEAGYLEHAKAFGAKWQKHEIALNILRPEPGASASDMAKAVGLAVQAASGNFSGVQIPIHAAVH